MSAMALLYNVLCRRNVGNRTLELVRFNLPMTSSQGRRKVLHDILDQSGAIALIEFVNPRGIVRKPRWDFLAILVFRYMAT